MTVGELIEALKKFDQNLPVVLANYEFGFDVLDSLQEVETVPTNEGDAPFVKAVGRDGKGRTTVLCLGPTEPSVLEPSLSERQAST